MLGKSKLTSFSRSQTSKGESPGDYVVTDILGPFATETFDKEKYALTYTDWYLHRTVYLAYLGTVVYYPPTNCGLLKSLAFDA